MTPTPWGRVGPPSFRVLCSCACSTCFPPFRISRPARGERLAHSISDCQAVRANPRLRCQRHRYLRYGQQFRKGRHRLLHPVDVRMHVVHAVQQHAQEPPQGFYAGIHVQDAAGHDLGLPDHVHLLRHHVPVRRAGVLADQQRMQPCPFLVPGVQVPDPGSRAAEEKEIRDHRQENARRAKAGQLRLRKRNWRRRARKPLLVWSGDTSASSPSGRIARKSDTIGNLI